MNSTLYISALALGFFGSFHCLGMCGPILLMLPKDSTSHWQISLGKLFYNVGRILTYILLGLLFGLFGFAAGLKGFQKELSIISGIIILLILLPINVPSIKKFSFLSIHSVFFRNKLKGLFSKKNYFSMFLIGSINGLLPCGLVYYAIAAATTTGMASGGMIYMGLFGLGTFPMMLSISYSASHFGMKFKKLNSKISPVIAVVLAVFLIYRGAFMNTSENCSHNINNHEAIYCKATKN